MNIKIIALLLFFSITHSTLFSQNSLSFFTKDYVFHLVIDSVDENNWGKPDRTVKSISIERIKDHKQIQKIIPPENYIVNSKEEMIFEDFNFDGNLDFKLRESFIKHIGDSYIYYLFDPKNEKFYSSQQLANVFPNIEVNRKNKTLSNILRMSGGDYKFVMYTFISNRLVLLEEIEDKSIGEDGHQLIHKKRINNQLKTISNRILDPKAYEKSKDPFKH